MHSTITYVGTVHISGRYISQDSTYARMTHWSGRLVHDFSVLYCHYYRPDRHEGFNFWEFRISGFLLDLPSSNLESENFPDGKKNPKIGYFSVSFYLVQNHNFSGHFCVRNRKKGKLQLHYFFLSALRFDMCSCFHRWSTQRTFAMRHLKNFGLSKKMLDGCVLPQALETVQVTP